MIPLTGSTSHSLFLRQTVSFDDLKAAMNPVTNRRYFGLKAKSGRSYSPIVFESSFQITDRLSTPYGAKSPCLHPRESFRYKPQFEHLR